MPINNYFNPNSYKPDSGGLMMTNAYDYQVDRQRFQEMADLQKMLAQAELAKQQEDLNEGRPVRQAQRGAQTSGFNLENQMNQFMNPQTMAQGKMGLFQSQQAAGQTALETMPGNIAQTNAQNRSKTLEDEARTLEVLASQGPLAVNEYYQRFRQGAPSWVGLPEVYDASVPGRLKQIQNAITQNPAHRRDIDKENVKGEWDIRKIQEQNKGRLAEARAKQTQKTMDYDQALKKANNIPAIMSITSQIEADPDLPEDQKSGLRARAGAALEMMRRLEAGRAEARTPPIEQAIRGGVGDSLQRRLEGGQPSGTPQPGRQSGGQQRHSMNDLRRMYPGKSDQWIKEAYKRKFGFDPLP